MVKGANNKETGFWMCMKHFVRPKLEQELGRRVKTVDLLRFGLPYWTVRFILIIKH